MYKGHLRRPDCNFPDGRDIRAPNQVVGGETVYAARGKRLSNQESKKLINRVHMGRVGKDCFNSNLSLGLAKTYPCPIQ